MADPPRETHGREGLALPQCSNPAVMVTPSQASSWPVPPNACHSMQPLVPIVQLIPVTRDPHRVFRNPGRMLSFHSAVPYSVHGEGRGHRPPLPVAMALPYGRLPLPATGQIYGNLPSPAVAGLHLVQLCPPVPGQRPQLPFQDGTCLQFCNQASLAPIQLAERSATAQAIPGPGASGNPMVLVLKEIDHQSIRASAPASGPSATGPKAGALEMRPGASTSSLAEGLTYPPGEPVETNSRRSICSQSSSACPSFSSAGASAENLKRLHEGSHGRDGQRNPRLESQLLPPAQERSLLMSSRDDIQLPENLLTESPDFEDLLSSMEPLLPDIFPSLDPTEPRDSWQAQELLATPPRPCDDIRGQSQEPQANKDVPIPRPSQGKPSEAPSKPKLNTKAKRGKSPASEGEPSRKVRKTNKSSDPTTAPNASGKGTALGAHKKPCSSLISGKKDGRSAPRKAAKSAANREVSLTMRSAESGKDLAPSKASKVAKEKTTTSVKAVVGPKQVATQEPPKPVARSHLALQMIESLNVFYPLGKGKLQLAPVKKQLPLAPSAPEKPLPLTGTWGRPLASLPRIPKISASRSGPQPPWQPPSKSVASSIPVVAHRAVAKPSILSHPCKPKASSSQLHEAHGWRRPASTSMKTSAPLPHPPVSGQSHWRVATNTQTPVVIVRRPTEPPASSSTSMKTSTPLPHPPVSGQSHWRVATNTQTPVVVVRRPTEPPASSSTSMKTSAPLPHPPVSGQSHWRVATNTQTPMVVVRRPTEPPASSTFKGDTFIPWRTPPPDLEVSKPITKEQRPIREMMKHRAQREREEAAHWTAVGRVKYFVEREKEMDLSIAYGYP